MSPPEKGRARSRFAASERAATGQMCGGHESIVQQPDSAAVRYHRKVMLLWPNESLLEQLRVIDAAEAMAAFDDDEYPPEVVRNTAIELASQRQAVHDILSYRERHGVEVPAPSYGIPREVIDEIKARRPIEAEVELMTDLRRSGKSCRGVCPICPGTSNPTSLAVSLDRQTWHCFKCSVGGDVIGWCMAVQKWDFMQALRYLSGVTGVELSTPAHASAGAAAESPKRLGLAALR